MIRISLILKKLSSSPMSFLLILSILGILGFGLLIPWLGFYWDDWLQISVYKFFSSSYFWDYFSYDRPLSAWTHVLAFPILGVNPIHWQIYSLFLRITTTIALWMTCNGIWPYKKVQVISISLLFFVYPVFTQQSISVAYSQHWLSFLIYFISLGAMVYAIRFRRFSIPLILVSIITSLGHLITTEFFLGLELLRPIILYLILDDVGQSTHSRIDRTIRFYIPFALVFVGVTIWRLFFIQLQAGKIHNPTLIFDLIRYPLAAIPRLIQISIQDLVQILISCWYRTISPALLDLSKPSNQFSWGISLITFFLIFFYTRHIFLQGKSTQNQIDPWWRQAVLVGFAAIILGTLPAWAIDTQVIVDSRSDRFAISAMFGSSIVFVGLMEWFFKGDRQKFIFISALIGLAVNSHIQNSNAYRWQWILQNRLYWQVYWRAPGIQPGTAIIMEEDPFPDFNIFSTSLAFNLLYPPPSAPEKLSYYLYSLRPRYNSADQLLNGTCFNSSHRIFHFETCTPNTLVLYYDPQKSSCALVLDTEDATNPYLPEIVRQAAPISNLQRIETDRIDWIPPEEIFGREPSPSWCFYFEKAELARQKFDWKTMVDLGDAARQAGYNPENQESNTPYEWLPFVEGYAHNNRWSEAMDLTLQLAQKDEIIASELCRLWISLQGEPISKTPSQSEAFDQINSALGCIR